jgi:hypothetical protein
MSTEKGNFERKPRKQRYKEFEINKMTGEIKEHKEKQRTHIHRISVLATLMMQSANTSETSVNFYHTSTQKTVIFVLAVRTLKLIH